MENTKSILKATESEKIDLGLTVKITDNSEFEEDTYIVSLEDKDGKIIVCDIFTNYNDANTAAALIRNLVCSLFYPEYREPDWKKIANEMDENEQDE